jgi:hypothetical protein
MKSTILVINKRHREDFTDSQKAAAAKHREAGGIITVRPNCGEDFPETELVNLNRDAAPLTAQPAKPAQTKPARRDFMTDSSMSRPDRLTLQFTRDDGSTFTVLQ